MFAPIPAPVSPAPGPSVLPSSKRKNSGPPAPVSPIPHPPASVSPPVSQVRAPPVATSSRPNVSLF